MAVVKYDLYEKDGVVSVNVGVSEGSRGFRIVCSFWCNGVWFCV